MSSNVSTSTVTIEDIAELARKLAEREPYKSASGPDALLALALYLETMTTNNDGGRRSVVQVEVRKKKAQIG
jgi:hypothetical protein